jgi:hypothetical protein
VHTPGNLFGFSETAQLFFFFNPTVCLRLIIQGQSRNMLELLHHWMKFPHFFYINFFSLFWKFINNVYSIIPSELKTFMTTYEIVPSYGQGLSYYLFLLISSPHSRYKLVYKLHWNQEATQRSPIIGLIPFTRIWYSWFPKNLCNLWKRVTLPQWRYVCPLPLMTKTGNIFEWKNTTKIFTIPFV